MHRNLRPVLYSGRHSAYIPISHLFLYRSTHQLLHLRPLRTEVLVQHDGQLVGLLLGEDLAGVLRVGGQVPEHLADQRRQLPVAVAEVLQHQDQSDAAGEEGREGERRLVNLGDIQWQAHA